MASEEGSGRPELSSSTIDPEAIIEVDDGQALGLLCYLGYYK